MRDRFCSGGHMNRIFIVSFTGNATPQTIKQLASITHDHGGKWLVSKVNFLEELVAGVIKVEIPQENEDLVKDAFAIMKAFWLNLAKQKTIFRTQKVSTN